MHLSTPLVRDLVLVGGGHAHALVLRAFGMRPMPGVRLTVIERSASAAYSGMLPGYVAGHYNRAALEIDVVRLARFAGARLILGGACGLEPDARLIHVPGRPPVAYDLASLDIGITAEMPALPGFAEHAVPAKPLAAFAARWEAFATRPAPSGRAPRVTVIGGGVAGVELALTMAHRLRQHHGGAEITVLDRGAILKDVAPRARATLRARAVAAGITLRADVAIAEVTAEGSRLDDGTLVTADLTVGAAGARPAPWLAATGLALHEGFVAVGPTLQSLSHRQVFAAGDCAHLAHAPRPKAGVYAVRAAPILEANLRAALAERPLRPFKPQGGYLKLITLGGKEALAQKGRLSHAGPAMWRLKDRIDRAFMAKLQDLPQMGAASVPHDAIPAVRHALAAQPLCGGCGAKIGPDRLRAALHPEGEAPGDDAAVMRAGDGWQVLSTDHLRAVVDDPELMARIALNHAMGDVWAMGAAPQIALSQITLPRMSEPLQSRTLADVFGASRALAAEIGVAIAGGHTTMGAEMVLGFTVTGLCATPPVTKGGAQPGDALILTRPLGSGTLLAAEMRGQAQGAWISDLWATLASPQRAAAEVLAAVARAMTDVTGFGLAGHAWEMAEASGAALRIDWPTVPLFDGAAELAAASVRSSIWEANRAAAAPHLTGLPDAPAAGLLFDPQTCGGLLAAVPASDADRALTALAAAGAPAWRVGEVTPGPPALVITALRPPA